MFGLGWILHSGFWIPTVHFSSNYLLLKWWFHSWTILQSTLNKDNAFDTTLLHCFEIQLVQCNNLLPGGHTKIVHQGLGKIYIVTLNLCLSFHHLNYLTSVVTWLVCIQCKLVTSVILSFCTKKLLYIECSVTLSNKLNDNINRVECNTV